MEILSVNSKEFAPYGKVLEGYDTAELVRALGGTPITDGVEYVMSEPELERLSITKELGVRAFGGLEIQLGWCNGHNTKLNALEYHRNSEINIGADDYILLLALVTDIDENGRLDTSKVKAFKAPAGAVVQVYETTLHYAPCSAEKGAGFRVMVALPKGTNGAMPDGFRANNEEDKTLWAANKWLLAHAESAEAKQGALVLLDGVNTDISNLI